MIKKFRQLFERQEWPKTDDDIKFDAIDFLIKDANVTAMILMVENDIIDKTLSGKIIYFLYDIYESYHTRPTANIKMIYRLVKSILDKYKKLVDVVDGNGFSLLMNASYISLDLALLVLDYNPDIFYRNPNNSNKDVFDMNENLTLTSLKLRYPKLYNKYMKNKNMKKFNI